MSCPKRYITVGLGIEGKRKSKNAVSGAFSTRDPVHCSFQVKLQGLPTDLPPPIRQFHDAIMNFPHAWSQSWYISTTGLPNMRKNPPQPPIPDRGISRKIPLNLPWGKDLNHLHIQLSDGLNLTAFLDHLETCEKCRQRQGKLIGELNRPIGGGGAS